MRPARILLAAAAVSLCGGASLPPDPSRCAKLFRAYDIAARLYATQRLDEDNGLVPPAPLSRPTQGLRNNGCVTGSEDLVDLTALAARLQPFAIDNSGPPIRAVPVHLGIVTSIYDEARVTWFFRGLGYRSRGIGAEALGRRLYIGPFTTQSALHQALSLAREAGFIAPFAATRTKF